MAVYTDVRADDLDAFLAGYDIGELLSYKGIAEGVENSNFLVHTRAAITSSRCTRSGWRRGDLPFFLGLMEHLAARGITCPQPVKNRSGEALGKLAGRPAAIVTFLDGMWIRRPSARHCAAVGEALAQTASRRRRFLRPARQRAVGRTAGGRCTSRRADRADSVQPGLARDDRATSSTHPGRRLAARPAAGRDPRRPVPRQRVLPRRQAVRPDRLLFRLHRRARLRRRDLPQRLVLRAGPLLQHHQGPRAAAGLHATPPAVGRRARRRCRCWRAARRCASC